MLNVFLKHGIYPFLFSIYNFHQVFKRLASSNGLPYLLCLFLSYINKHKHSFYVACMNLLILWQILQKLFKGTHLSLLLYFPVQIQTVVGVRYVSNLPPLLVCI